MSTLLFAWELGMGLGHAAQTAMLANPIAAQGHRVFAALRDLRAGQGVFDPTVIPLSAPFRLGGTTSATLSFASILSDIGFGDERTLPVVAAAWRNLFKLTKPDLIVFDHSPTALLAARGIPARRLVIGVGFCVPPNVAPFPAFQSGVTTDAIQAAEAPLLERANRVLQLWKQPPLPCLAELYTEVDQTLLTTFPEFDCYRRERAKKAAYIGPINAGAGAAPVWPAADGKRIFAYLKPFPALKPLLAFLKEQRLPSLVFIDGLDPAIHDEFACDSLHFATQRLDLAQVGRECELAIINGAHATTIAMLLAGKPSLQIPHFLEHTLNARAVERLGAGLMASKSDPDAIIQQLRRLLNSDQYAKAARRFAARYKDFDPNRQPQAMLQRVLPLLPRPANRSVGTPSLANAGA